MNKKLLVLPLMLLFVCCGCGENDKPREGEYFYYNMEYVNSQFVFDRISISDKYISVINTMTNRTDKITYNIKPYTQSAILLDPDDNLYSSYMFVLGEKTICYHKNYQYILEKER